MGAEKGDIAPLAVPQADRPYFIAISRQAQAFPTRRRDCKTSPRGPAFRPRYANFDAAALLANKGRRQRQTTTRRNKSLARAEMGSSAETKTTARSLARAEMAPSAKTNGKGVKEKGWTSWGVGEKGECLRWLNT